MWLGFYAQFNDIGVAIKATSHRKKRESFSEDAQKAGFDIGWVGKSYLLGLVAVEIWGQFLHPLILGDNLPFLPLILISVYCAIGVFYSWIWQLRCIIR